MTIPNLIPCLIMLTKLNRNYDFDTLETMQSFYIRINSNICLSSVKD